MTEEIESKRFKDVQTEKRINEHLNNEDDLISEEDIFNIKTNIGETEPIDTIPPVKERLLQIEKNKLAED